MYLQRAHALGDDLWDLGGGITDSDVLWATASDATINSASGGFNFLTDIFSPLLKVGLGLGTAYATQALVGGQSGRSASGQPLYGAYNAQPGILSPNVGVAATQQLQQLQQAAGASNTPQDFTPWIIGGVALMVLVVVLK